MGYERFTKENILFNEKTLLKQKVVKENTLYNRAVPVKHYNGHGACRYFLPA
jgi:hypothetical protein